MKSSEIEYWAHQVMDRVDAGHAVEDGRVELKREWIQAEKAARQIAAHANAARGESILWLIGVDEKEGVIGVGHEEFSNWFNSVVSCFDGLAPNCDDLNVPRQGRTTTALVFDTTRAPFVVKNPQHGKVAGDGIAFEVPWREGRKTRSARREELLRLLVPASHVPALEWLEAKLTIRETIPAGEKEFPLRGKDRRFTWDLEARLYFEPVSELRLVIPFHRCEVQIQLPGQTEKRDAAELLLGPPNKMSVENRSFGFVPDSQTITSTGSELIIGGPGMLDLASVMNTDLPGLWEPDGLAKVWVRFGVSGLDIPVLSTLDLKPDMSAWEASGKKDVVWKLRVDEK